MSRLLSCVLGFGSLVAAVFVGVALPAAAAASQVVTTTGVYSCTNEVSATVTARVTADEVVSGRPLSVSVATTVVVDHAKFLSHFRAYHGGVTVPVLSADVSGASVDSVPITDGVKRGVPAANEVYESEAVTSSLGVVTALPGGEVALALGPIAIGGYGYGEDKLDGLRTEWQPGSLCTPDKGAAPARLIASAAPVTTHTRLTFQCALAPLPGSSTTELTYPSASFDVTVPNGGELVDAAGGAATLSGVSVTASEFVGTVGFVAYGPSGETVRFASPVGTLPDIELPDVSGPWTLAAESAQLQGTGCRAVNSSHLAIRGDIASFSVTRGATPTPTPTPTPTVTPPTPTPTDPARASYTIAGTAMLRTLVKGSLPLSGSATLAFNTSTGVFSGDPVFAQATANLTALGILPVTATVKLVATAPLTGIVTGAGATASVKARIKLPSIKTFGIQLGGANCQATQASTIALTSASFSAASGGTLAGTFAISNVSGCGVLNGIISPLTAGTGNSIALKLAPSIS